MHFEFSHEVPVESAVFSYWPNGKWRLDILCDGRWTIVWY